MAQSAIKIFEKHGLTPPAIIGVFHSSTKENPHGRFKDLAPQSAFQGPLKPLVDSEFKVDDLHGNSYLQVIAERIVPKITETLNFKPTFENTAMVGSSMGGLATLNALGVKKDLFATALAFSPHWVMGGKPLVDYILNELPKPGSHKVWMSRGDQKLDGTYKHDQEYANQMMHQLGWNSNFKTTIYKGAGHNERAWAKQISSALDFWLLD